MTTLNNADEINDKGESYGECFADAGISKTQLRRIYSQIKDAEREYENQNEEQAKDQLKLLRPLLFRMAARDAGSGNEGENEEENESEDENEASGMEMVKDEIWCQIETAVDGDGDLERFFQLMEATVAYHYYYDTMKEDEDE
ncbi:type III-A CRISPR-associated protein Csm2 [Halocatena salina]|uniref:CRISPR system Cms protein Csm2 n=1 Tax=Halocatena salina TaxID=2934340 RepID=A0A8U0A057_9EURY|nr:type III-A CRISPR-associated protein Csm2 [Halocatena salina]UPM42480.1 type III-A CRISPR-associated protein Csm2 [Halocatena salina]